MTATRYETRQKIEKLLALANRPGTPAEGEAALAAAERLASRYGFSVRRRRLAQVRAERVAWLDYCSYCGAGFRRAATGRPRIYCSDRCRVAAHRRRHR